MMKSVIKRKRHPFWEFLVFLTMAVCAVTWSAVASAATSQCFYAEADTFAWDNFGNNRDENYGGANSLGIAHLGDTSLDQRNTYVRFNLDAIPEDATVLSADLELYLTDINGTGNATYTRMQAVAESWAEYWVTWNDQPSRLSTIHDEYTLTDSPGWKSWSADSLVHQWVTGVQTNHGMVLSSGGLGSSPAHFHSREGSSTRAPRLCVEWTTGPVSTDLTVSDIEVTQAIQDLNNSVRLVAEKRTYVRAHVNNSSGLFRTFATLEVDNGSDSTILYPINDNAGHVVARPDPNREMLNHAFLFKLPSDYTSGNITLTAEVNPITSWRTSRYPPETDYSNNSHSVSVSFEEVPRLGVVTYLGKYAVDDGNGNLTEYTTPGIEASQMMDWLRRAYPISSIWYTFRSYDAGDSGVPTADTVNAWLATKREYDLNHDVWYEHRVGDKADIRYYGMMIDEGGFMRGKGKIDGHVSSGPTGNQVAEFVAWDTDGSYGDWYGAHELGHNFDRLHVEECGAKGGASYPYTDGRISPELTGDEAIFGFDIGTAYNKRFSTREQDIAVYDPEWRDVMSYCDNQWLSDFTYHALMNYFQGNINTLGTTGSSVYARSSHMDRLLVVGYIDPDTKETNLQPLFVIPDAQDTNPLTPGDYAIVLLDGGGNELARYPFTPEPMESGPGRLDSRFSEDISLLVSELVPYVSGTTQVVVEGPSGLLASISAGVNPPAVTVISPTGGGSLSTDPVEVSWAGSDPDGDSLTYNVQFSPDGGLSWEMVAQNIEGTSTQIPRLNLPGTSEGLFRVWASDGIHTTSDVSDDTFSLPYHPVEVEIIAPASGTYVSSKQTLSLEANTYSPSVGSVESSNITWVSSIDSILGTGADLSVTGLTPGSHTISVWVSDPAGLRVESVSDIIVVENPTLLPTLGNELEIGPKQLNFWPELGTSTRKLIIDNRSGANSIEWSAFPLDSWVTLGSTVGSTPAEITVSIDASALPAGLHTTSIALGSNATPPGVKVVDVVVWSFGRNAFEPILFQDRFE